MVAGLRLRITALRTLTQHLNGLFEIIESVELTIDGGEAQIGDHVEVTQEREDGFADFVRRHVGDAGRAQLLLNLLSENRELIIRNRPSLTGFLNARHNLVTGERLNNARALDDLERGRFEGRETLLAVRALTPTPNPGYDRKGSAPLNGTRSDTHLSQESHASPSTDRNNHTLTRLQSPLHVIHALNVSDNLLERTIRLDILSQRPHRIATDDRLRHRRTIVGGGLDSETESTGPHGENERRERTGDNAATRGAGAATRSRRRAQVGRVIDALSLDTATGGRSGGDVTNGRQRRILHCTTRRAARGERDGSLRREGDTHENLQNTFIEHLFVEHLYDSTLHDQCRDPLEHMFHFARSRLILDVSSGRPAMHICVHPDAKETP